jgi:unsaturated rhamnogalacturonyl hydrolase
MAALLDCLAVSALCEVGKKIGAKVRIDMDNSTQIEKVKQALLAMQRFSWEQGVAAQAFLELGEEPLAVLMAKEAVHRQNQEGRLAILGPDAGVTDPAANGQAVLLAAQITGDPELQAAAERMLDYLLHRAPHAADGTLYHVTDRPQVWIDSMYMAPPFLAEAEHPREAMKQIEGWRRRLWNPASQLYSHIWDEEKQVFARASFWGVGNGWAAAGMTRLIRLLPPEMKDEKRRLAQYVREVLDGCLAYQRPDGLFHDVVDDPTTFVETNLAQMLAYSIYRGIQEGWLDSTYRAAADRMRAAARMKVDAFGLVQGVCGAPDFSHPGTAAEGQAFFLLMEAAAADFKK